MLYTVPITEYRVVYVDVRADSREEALDKAFDRYESGEFSSTLDDPTSVEEVMVGTDEDW